ncbi:thioredoxin [archaeon]|nr:thioredoxin [archaeon]MBT3451289.1 thioredoxin [archaeon]MBT6869450.1 thioredoxin [archaeon]MBT7192613.1 thioredoxin [archaeon]MBT7380689.1 thioredoxin [archaeon]
MAVEKLNKENFEILFDGDGLKIIDFWASWCGPCKMMGPVFEELSGDSEFENKLKFLKLSTEEESELASKFSIQGIPTLVVFNGKEEIGRTVGFLPKDALKSKIKEIISKA